MLKCDFAFIHMPAKLLMPDANPIFHYDLNTILDINKPLGIPWHVSRKKARTSPRFLIIPVSTGTCVHTQSRFPKNSKQKATKLMAFIAIANAPIPHAAFTSLDGTLQHLTFVYRDGRSYLPHLSPFLSKFLNNFVRHHVPLSMLGDLCWWSAILVGPLAICLLAPHQALDPDILANASTSWGIGLIVGNHWAAL